MSLFDLIEFFLQQSTPQITLPKTNITGFLIFIVLIGLIFGAISFLSKKHVEKKFEVKKVPFKAFKNMLELKKFKPAEIELLYACVTKFQNLSVNLIFSNKQNTKNFIRRAIKLVNEGTIVENGVDKETTKNKLFKILARLDDIYESQIISITSKDIKAGKKVRLYIEDYGYFFSEVMMTNEKGLFLKKPNRGDIKEWKKPVVVYFWNENDAGYSFNSFIDDVVDEDNFKALFILHSSFLTRYQKRKYIRKKVKFYSTFVLINVMFKDGNKKYVYDDSEYDGTVYELSVGGCSLETNINSQVKQLLKLSIYIQRDIVETFAQIVWIGKKNNKFIYHMKFLKTPKIFQNKLFEITYLRNNKKV